MTRDEFRHHFTKCWICGQAATDVHEIARGPSRQAALKEPAAYFRCCRECHQGELDSMPIAKQLGYKLLHDATRYNRAKVNELRHRAKDAISEADVAIEIAAIFERFRR